MPRGKNPNREKAYELYKQHSGNITNREIAKQLGEDEKKVAVWKQRDQWNVVQQKKERCTTKQKRTTNRKIDKEMERVVESVMENDDLTDKQRLFCIYYVKYFNATKAALKAGYSPDTASKQGHQLLEKTRLRDEIMRLKAEKMKGALLEPGDILQKYIDIAFSDITDYVEFGREDVQVMTMYGPLFKKDENGTETPVMHTVDYVKLKESSEVDGTIISEIKKGSAGIGVKLQDKMKAMEFLARNIGLLDIETTQKLKREQEKLELEKARFELDSKKVEQTVGHQEQQADDGFIAALSSVAGEVWEDYACDESDIQVPSVLDEAEAGTNMVD